MSIDSIGAQLRGKEKEKDHGPKVSTYLVMMEWQRCWMSFVAWSTCNVSRISSGRVTRSVDLGVYAARGCRQDVVSVDSNR